MNGVVKVRWRHSSYSKDTSTTQINKPTTDGISIKPSDTRMLLYSFLFFAARLPGAVAPEADEAAGAAEEAGVDARDVSIARF